MSPPPVPGRPTSPPEPPHQVDHHTKISASSESVSTPKSPVKIPPNPTFSLSASFPAGCSSFPGAHTSSESSSSGASFPTCGMSYSPVFGSQSPFSSPSVLFTAPASFHSQISVVSGNLDSNGTQILNLLDQTIKTPHSIADLAFKLDSNFKSDLPPSVNLAATAPLFNLSSVQAPLFNYSLQCNRPVMGSNIRPPIAGFGSPVINPQFPSSSPISSPFPTQLTPQSTDSSEIDPGSGSIGPSPTYGHAPVIFGQVNSVNTPSQLGRVNSPVNSTASRLNTGTAFCCSFSYSSGSWGRAGVCLWHCIFRFWVTSHAHSPSSLSVQYFGGFRHLCPVCYTLDFIRGFYGFSAGSCSPFIFLGNRFCSVTSQQRVIISTYL